MARVFNFSAGPATLPDEVLVKVRDELLDWRGTGMSVMEMSHRGKAFMSIAEQSEADLRALLAIPDTYKVLFLQGGATMQFAAVPLNLSAPGDVVDHALTGSWSKKAVAEARRYVEVNLATDTLSEKRNGVAPLDEWRLSDRAAYLHYCANETIGGIEFGFIPEHGGVPVVADMSSCLLSRPLEVSRFGVIYAGAQKNVGPAGLTLAVVREDLLGRARSDIPTLLDYKVMAESGSMSNTPPTFAWYVAGEVFKWLQQQGGLAVMEERNRRKAGLLYEFIDASAFYSNPVALDSRSIMNVPFTLADPSLDGQFLLEAEQAGLSGLKGHRSVGGMRASIYNAMPEAGVAALIEFMDDFERRRT